MVYITGDCHGDFNRFVGFSAVVEPTAEDVVIILGDVGFNYFKNNKDANRKRFVNSFPFTTFCIHGNHEVRPHTLPAYKLKEYHGGLVWYEERFPNILFAKDGEIYDFDGFSCLAIGGAYSVDKFYRQRNKWPWFADEQPDEETKKKVESVLEERGYAVDIVLSHTCPVIYEPVEMFIQGLDQSTVDKSTEEWLGEIESKLDYKHWYCGHYHTAKKIDKLQFMYEDFDVLSGR